jgi:tRNA threonylcarbamoyladenosine biosynthesis protein TsaE
MQTLKQYRTEAPDQTIRLGLEIGKQLPPGSVVALYGPLGAGKTTLVKGIARSLNIEEAVTSPSFTLISEYEGYREGIPITLYHIDLYRISHPQEIEDLGMAEILNGEGICVVEWAEKAEEFLPESTVRVEIVIGDREKRQIKVRGISPA